jgi:orotate phosphoribosyltransferase
MAPVQSEDDDTYNGPNFVAFALLEKVLKFGDYTTKAGRKTPYFFNAGDFYSSKALAQLGHYYANMLIRKFGAGNTDNDLNDLLPDAVLFGPAYKGIGIVYTVATILGEVYNIPVDVAYNRKEAKDHGEGGLLVGANMKDRNVIMLEDVVTTNKAKYEAAELIADAGGNLIGCGIAFDRQEKGVTEDGQMTEHSAAQEFMRKLGVPMFSIATLSDMITAFDMEGIKGAPAAWNEYIGRIKAYRDQYGAVL